MRGGGEEPGRAPGDLGRMAGAPDPPTSELPDGMIGKVWGGRYRGQRQHWFLYRFTGTDDDIDIATAHPEFRAWRWADPADLPALIVPFKKALYEQVLAAFAPHLS